MTLTDYYQDLEKSEKQIDLLVSITSICNRAVTEDTFQVGNTGQCQPALLLLRQRGDECPYTGRLTATDWVRYQELHAFNLSIQETEADGHF